MVRRNARSGWNNSNNSPGLRPIGVLDPLRGCVSKFPDRAKWAPQGSRRRKSVRRGRGGSGSISPGVMAPCDLQGILTTHSRSLLKMQRFELSIDLDFANCFFEKGCQLKRFFFGTFQPSSRMPRDTVEMQGFELVAIFVATSNLQNIFLGPLRAPKEPSGMENWPRDPWVTASPSARQIVCIFTGDSGQQCLGHCKHAAILAVEFHHVKMQSICLADGEGVSQGSRSHFSIPEGSLGARKAPWKKFCESEVATKMATSSNPCISTVPRGLIEEG